MFLLLLSVVTTAFCCCGKGLLGVTHCHWFCCVGHILAVSASHNALGTEATLGGLCDLSHLIKRLML